MQRAKRHDSASLSPSQNTVKMQSLPNACCPIIAMNEAKFHTTVLKQEAIEFLRVAPKRKFVDGTLGAGGHSIEIVRGGGEVLGLDQDRTALMYARQRFIRELPAGFVNNSLLVQGNFKHMYPLSVRYGFDQVSGVVLDLGMSSFHINASQRGFTFQKDELLDMRMDAFSSKNASDIVNNASAQKLYEIITNFGEQHRAKELIDRIEHTRSVTPIRTSFELVKILEEVFGTSLNKIPHEDLARIFQSFRIAVNDELDSLRLGLHGAVSLLKPEGRLVVISFHSLEDRIVKLFLRQHKELKLITNKAVRPTDDEVRENSRSRSARLRVAEKI